MVYALLLLLCLYAGVTGYGLAANDANVWVLLVFSIGALVCLQVSYLATWVVRALA